MDPRWQPRPSHEPSPHLPGPSMAGWLEERLFDQRIVMIRGPFTQQDATSVAAALLTLDASGPSPVHLHVASSDGQLLAAHAVTDVIVGLFI
ncbi:ATP-dependent Clp protease proteolytic subunit [Actinoplanes sp. NPDC051633]|uniref:ATP-dependent Clp protease proteolytic subunit n=1 Tax=Actinoplanes sp. NPDC051633 TaxID=3155670 RepID=UPI0034167169